MAFFTSSFLKRPIFWSWYALMG